MTEPRCGGHGKIRTDWDGPDMSRLYRPCPGCEDCKPNRLQEQYERQMRGMQNFKPKCGTCGGNVWFAGTDTPCPDCTPKPPAHIEGTHGDCGQECVCFERGHQAGEDFI